MVEYYRVWRDGNLYLLWEGRPVDACCAEPPCSGWEPVRVFLLPSPTTAGAVVLACDRYHKRFVKPADLPLRHLFAVRRGPALGQWTFSWTLDDSDLAYRIVERWKREHPDQYAVIERCGGGAFVTVTPHAGSGRASPPATGGAVGESAAPGARPHLICAAPMAAVPLPPGRGGSTSPARS